MPHGSWNPAFPATTGSDTIDASVRARASRKDPNHLTTILRSSKSNWNRVDDLQPATGIAVLYVDRHEVSHAIRIMGVHCNRLRPFDADPLPNRSCSTQPSATLL